MTRPQHRPVRPQTARQSGQSMTEYLLLCAIVALTLGLGLIDDNSPLRQLLGAFQEAYARVSFSLSLP